jgi:hypothetical protein
MDVYTDRVRLLRWQSVIHLCACVILTWTAVDLLVPQLCAAESSTLAGDVSHSDDESPERPDSDCFCCSHIVTPVSCEAVFALVTVVDVVAFPTSRLSLGVPRLLYHPPLQA